MVSSVFEELVVSCRHCPYLYVLGYDSQPHCIPLNLYQHPDFTSSSPNHLLTIIPNTAILNQSTTSCHSTWITSPLLSNLCQHLCIKELQLTRTLFESCGRVDNDIQESVETWGFIICTKESRNSVKFTEKSREKDSDELILHEFMSTGLHRFMFLKTNVAGAFNLAVSVKERGILFQVQCLFHLQYLLTVLGF